MGAVVDRFLDAVANGFALFYCAVACGVAARNWSGHRARGLAGFAALLCLVTAFLSLERSVWIGAAAGTLIVLVTTSWLRRYLAPIVACAAVSLVAAFFLIPASNSQSPAARVRSARSGTERT